MDRQEIRAQLRPVRYTTLSAEIGAVVQSILVKEGQRFAAGTPLIKLDCGLHDAQRAKSMAELAGAKRSLEANQRLAELNAAGLMELDLAKNAVEKSQAELQISETQLSKCEIKAPFAGIVAEQRIREQQYVQPGTPVVDVLDDSGYELEFLAPSTWLSRLRVGMVVRVYIDEVRRNGLARIARISPRIDPVSQSIKVTANLEGPMADLKAGMSGRLQLP
jgi:RND family efflux transporter MFP subunit